MGPFTWVKPVGNRYFQAATMDAQSERYRMQFDTAFHHQDWCIGMWEARFAPEWPTAGGPMPGRYRFWYDPTEREIVVVY